MPILARIVLLTMLLFPTWAQGNDLVKLDTNAPLRDVYFLPDSDSDLITVVMVILAGEVDFEGPEGLAHYLEHLMFWHADNVKGEAIHSRQGNAWVNGLVTSYYNRGEESELPDMIEFSKRILSLPNLTLSFMLGERNVVTREYDLRVSENPDWRVLTDVRKELYDQHPISRSVIGTRESIGSLTIDHATAFHKQFYHPANAILIVSGDVSEKKLTKLVNSRFGNLSKSENSTIAPHTQSWRGEPVLGKIDRTINYSEKQAAASRLVYTSLSEWSNENNDALQAQYTIQFAQRLLESALPGSLAKPLRLDNFIVSQYDLSVFKLLDEQLEMNIFAWPDDGISLDTVNESLVAALQKLGSEGVPQKSFDRLKKRWLQTAKREGSDVDTLLWRTWYHIMIGTEPNSQANHLERIESTTLSDLNSLIKALSTPQRTVVGLINGESK